ncbi:glycoside hydrolase family 31 protein [Tenacibaculum xiamenense]|uniref:glycoside hydrolase family 31 protein n=1 Tax=Tenacibaculum xiamenense TaxID=1261553 RepID=UPI003893CE97
MKRLHILIFFLCFNIYGQNTSRVFNNIIEEKKGVLRLKMNDGEYRLQFYLPDVVETSFIPDGEKYSKKSHAVILKPQKVITKFKETDKAIYFASKKLKVVIQKFPFKISYFYGKKELISEKRGYVKTEKYETIELNLEKEEVLYGGGARALEMNRRGYRLELYNKAHYGYETHSELMNYTMPVVLSSKRYMVHFDNAPIGFLDLDSKKNNTLTYETISGRKTYQIIAGQSWYDVLDNYTELTGRQPMIPRWALGNFSSRFGYHSQKEVENTIQKFKEDNIPVDAVILDLFWFGKDIKGTMGNLEPYKDSFPDFNGMVVGLKEKNIKTIAITEPYILTTSKRWKEAVQEDILAKTKEGKLATYDFYFGNTGIIDVYSQKGKAWFWDIYKGLVDIGIAGVWGDLGEPEVHPDWVQHETGSANEVHNIYGHDWAKLIAKGYEKYFPETRPFVLMRAGYSGSQRFGLIPWSGDVNRTWGGFKRQPEIALQMGMQGLGYMHSDLGGFAGDNLDDELYVRWLQYGVFQPIYRPHAQEQVPSEPVFRSEKAKERAKIAIELRYKLLPYNYHLVYENNSKGTPLMRPLFFDFQSPKTEKLGTTYLWGNDFLISPQLDKDVKKHSIFIPKATVWFDFYSDKRIVGEGEEMEIPKRENSIPTLVRAGSFIPMTRDIQNTEAYNANELTIHYYHDDTIQSSNRYLYNDDGKTANALEKGMFELVKFSSNFNGKSLKIQLNTELGNNYKAQEKQYKLVIHNVKKEVKKVLINGKLVTPIKKVNNIEIPVTWNTKKKQIIKLKF